MIGCGPRKGYLRNVLIFNGTLQRKLDNANNWILVLNDLYFKLLL